MSKVLSVLISINVQAKSDINLGGQGMVIQIKGWLSNRVFMQAKHMQFYKVGHWVVFIKTTTQYASKDGIELAVFVAFGEVLSFGLGVVELVLVLLLSVLLVDGLSLVHSVFYSTHNQSSNQCKDSSLSSNREHIKYGDRSGIFEWFLNGKAKTWLSEAW